LLNYFGERLEHDCGNCDVCLNPPEQFDATVAAQKALSCVYRLGQGFGVKHVVDVLRGADNERVRSRNHQQLSTYGLGSDRSDQEWTSIIRQLIHHGYLLQDIANYSVLKLTEASRPLLRGDQALYLAKPRIREKTRKKRPMADVAHGPYDEILFDQLRDLRKRIASEQGVPAYIVFGDNSLVQMARDKPMDEAGLLDLRYTVQIRADSCSPDEAQRNPGVRACAIPDYVSLHPGYHFVGSRIVGCAVRTIREAQLFAWNGAHGAPYIAFITTSSGRGSSRGSGG